MPLIDGAETFDFPARCGDWTPTAGIIGPRPTTILFPPGTG